MSLNMITGSAQNVDVKPAKYTKTSIIYIDLNGLSLAPFHKSRVNTTV